LQNNRYFVSIFGIIDIFNSIKSITEIEQQRSLYKTFIPVERSVPDIWPQLVIECASTELVGTFPDLIKYHGRFCRNWLIEIKPELRRYEEENWKEAALMELNLIVTNQSTI